MRNLFVLQPVVVLSSGPEEHQSVSPVLSYLR